MGESWVVVPPPRLSRCPPLPRQYVALTFYMELLNADAPELADILAFDHNKCMFDGARGEELSWVRSVRGREYMDSDTHA